MLLNTLTGFSNAHGQPAAKPTIRHCSATSAALPWKCGSLARLDSNQRDPETATSVHGGKPMTMTTFSERMI